MEFNVSFKDVKSLDSSKDSDFIHRNIGDMLAFLGFSFEDSWFRIISEKGCAFVPTLGQVKKVYPDMPGVRSFIRHQKYSRSPDSITSLTSHQTYMDLLSSCCASYCVASNSTVGLENKVIGLNEAMKLFNKCEHHSLLLAFDNKYIVQSGPSYFIHPLFLYDLCLKKKK